MRTQTARSYRRPVPAAVPETADAPRPPVSLPRVAADVPGVPAGVLGVPADTVRVRPARADDGERVRCFLGGLSPRTRAQRFFTEVGDPGTRLVRSLLAVDEHRDALLAVRGELVVGHAMSHRGQGAAIEIAVVVDDEWQAMGIGSRLVRTLMRRAAARGAATVQMDVLGDNRRVLAIVRRMWPDAVMRASSGAVEVTAAIIR